MHVSSCLPRPKSKLECDVGASSSPTWHPHLQVRVLVRVSKFEYHMHAHTRRHHGPLFGLSTHIQANSMPSPPSSTIQCIFFFFALHIESGSVHRFSPLASHHLIMANQWLGYGRRVHNSQAEKRRRLCSLGIPAEINQVLRSWCLVPTKVEGSTHTSASLCRLPCSATSMFAGPAHAHESTV